MDAVDSPGRQTDARAELERRVERAADRAAARFLAGVCTDALAAVEGTVMVAAAVEPFTLGQVMTRWAPASERIAAAVVTAAGSPDMPSTVDRTYLARVQARIAASNLPLDVHRDVRDTLTGPLASRLDGRPDRGQMKAALRKSLRAPRERSVYRAQVNRIARTETTSLFGYATQAKLTAEAVPGKRWVAHHDARTRPTHAAASGQTVAVMDPFLVGGYALMHPGDPAGPAKETASCRCVMTAVKRFSSPLAPPSAPFTRNTSVSTFDYSGLPDIPSGRVDQEQDETLRAILTRQHMNEPPRIVSAAEFQQVAEASPNQAMFRGFHETDESQFKAALGELRHSPAREAVDRNRRIRKRDLLRHRHTWRGIHRRQREGDGGSAGPKREGHNTRRPVRRHVHGRGGTIRGTAAGHLRYGTIRRDQGIRRDPRPTARHGLLRCPQPRRAHREGDALMFPASLSHRLAKVAQRVTYADRPGWTRAVEDAEESGVTRWENLPAHVRAGRAPVDERSRS